VRYEIFMAVKITLLKAEDGRNRLPWNVGNHPQKCTVPWSTRTQSWVSLIAIITQITNYTALLVHKTHFLRYNLIRPTRIIHAVTTLRAFQRC
jgi:hypothetical protein